MSFQAKPVVIFGATGGIGSALARRLARQGAPVLLCARGEEKLLALAGEVNGSSRVVDATRTEEVEAAVQDAVSSFGSVYGVVNCVGSILLKPAHATTDAEWLSTIQLNLHTAFAALRAGVKAMKEGGCIVLLSSAAARLGLTNHEAIAAAKAGVIGLTLSAAATYAPKNIRVNCVAPGLVDTPLAARITGNELALKASQAMHPLGRIGKAEDVAAAIAWLLDPEQSWVTGQVLGVDGGLATVRAR